MVKGMLWAAAGKGLPPEFQIDTPIMPYKGHSIEARIYAEDPLRGYLPSTGPLVPYVEPEATGKGSSYLRLDSGVSQGHVVSPYYDPMLSKIISYGQTRQEAIDILANGLDRYVIEGVRHNARLCNAVLRHPEFVAGNTPTSFLPNHIPEFKGVQLSDSQMEEMALSVALIQLTRESYLQRPLVEEPDAPVVVKLGGMFGTPFSIEIGDEGATVKRLPSHDDDIEGASRFIAFDDLEYEPERYLAHVALDGVARTLQVLDEDMTGEIFIQMYGAKMKCLMESPREYELSKWMHVPKEVDTSNFVMSPMPGTLISYAVKEGDSVELDQELCIVEAMKMQNIIRAPRAGIIRHCLVDVGSSMMADQIILEYMHEEEESEAA